MRSDSGFSLVEMILALVLTLALTGAVFTLVNQAQAESQSQPEAIDMQQRARVATDVLFHDLVTAGAGLSAGPAAGPLVYAAPPIVPRRTGLQGADAPTVARGDAISVMRVVGTPVQTTISAPLTSPADDLLVDSPANCAAGLPLCGLAPGMTVVLLDSIGHFDRFAITQAGPTAARVQLLGRAQSTAYQPGDALAEVELHTYYFDTVNHQLRHYDGNATDVPVIDNVVSLSFEYFGDPRPPARPKPPLGVANCLYDAAGAAAPLLELTPEGGSLAPLPLAMLADGPWCGSGSSQFDVDLLRVRAIRVTLRVQATPAAFRASGSAFLHAGSSRSANRWLADFVMRFDVTPRNMNLGR